MALDWKDALSALKDSGDIPVDNTPAEPDEPASQTDAVQKNALHVLVEKKGRGGKTATIVEGFEGSGETLEKIARTLKRKLGTGGSARGGEILIQGDRKADVIALLKSLGYKTKG